MYLKYGFKAQCVAVEEEAFTSKMYPLLFDDKGFCANFQIASSFIQSHREMLKKITAKHTKKEKKREYEMQFNFALCYFII